MDSQELNQRLSRISTQWTMVFRAHDAQGDGTQAAVERLLERYGGAAFRYLLGAVRDPDVAEELAQEFALRFIRGDFGRADPERGRFRNYLKTALVNLVNDHHRKRQAWHQPLGVEPAAPDADRLDSERDFTTSWREELLERTWKALAQANPGYHAALHFRVENPDVPSAQMAEHLAACLAKPVSASSARKMLERAHSKFADLLVEEVWFSMENAATEELENELNDLDLLKYCRSALERR